MLENDPASFELPTTACAIGGSVYTVANSQLDAYRSGALAEGRRLEQPRILRTPL